MTLDPLAIGLAIAVLWPWSRSGRRFFGNVNITRALGRPSPVVREDDDARSRGPLGSMRRRSAWPTKRT